jgi:hypothetical protein
MPPPDEPTGLTSDEHRSRALTCFVCAIGCVTIGLSVLSFGEFRIGKHSGPVIRPETQPFFYWTSVGGLFALAVVGAIFGILELREARRQRVAMWARPERSADTAGVAADGAAPAPRGFERGASPLGEPRIRHRLTGIGCVWAFLVMWLVVWTYGCSFMTYSAVFMKESVSLSEAIFLAAMWGGELLVLAVMLPMLAATSTFTFRPDRLVIERSLLGVRRVRSIQRQDVGRVRQVKDPRGRWDSFPSWSIVIEGKKRVTLLSNEKLEKGAWFGRIVAQWARVEFEEWP